MSDSSGFIYDKDGINTEKLKYLMKIKNVDRERISKYAKFSQLTILKQNPLGS